MESSIHERMHPADITLRHCYDHVGTTDHLYDVGHSRTHCLDVWRRIRRCYTSRESEISHEREFSSVEELTILEAAALFHEQGDTKFGQDLAENEAALQAAMQRDQLHPRVREVILELIGNCSFKKRHLWPENPKIAYMMDLLCAADLAEAVDRGAVNRAYGFHRRRIAKRRGVSEAEVEDRDVWKNVREFFYLVGADGYQARLAAIRVQKIRDELQGCTEYNNAIMVEMCRRYQLS